MQSIAMVTLLGWSVVAGGVGGPGDAVVAPWEIAARYAPDGALGARWVEMSRDGDVLVVMETKVTVAQWRAAMGDGPPAPAGCPEPDCALIRVTPVAMLAFANRVSDLEGLDRCYDIEGAEGDAATGTLARAVTITVLEGCGGYRLPFSDELAWLIATEPLVDAPDALHAAAWFGLPSSDPRASAPVARKWPTYQGVFDVLGIAPELAFDPEPDPFHLAKGWEPARFEGTRVALSGCDMQAHPSTCGRELYITPFGLDVPHLPYGLRLVRRY